MGFCYHFSTTGCCPNGKHCRNEHDESTGAIIVLKKAYTIKSESCTNSATFKDISKKVEKSACGVYGKKRQIKSMAVSTNRAEYLNGNIYIEFNNKHDAAAAAGEMNNVPIRDGAEPIEFVLTPMRNHLMSYCCKKFGADMKMLQKIEDGEDNSIKKVKDKKNADRKGQGSQMVVKEKKVQKGKLKGFYCIQDASCGLLHLQSVERVGHKPRTADEDECDRAEE